MQLDSILFNFFDYQDAEVPWHLIAIAVFFVLLKLPGAYYPYWGRMLIPHFANGALLRVFGWVASCTKGQKSL